VYRLVHITFPLSIQLLGTKPHCGYSGHDRAATIDTILLYREAQSLVIKDTQTLRARNENLAADLALNYDDNPFERYFGILGSKVLVVWARDSTTGASDRL
jgi:hypothetical protein